jgi:hypothetical protein
MLGEGTGQPVIVATARLFIHVQKIGASGSDRGSGRRFGAATFMGTM